MKEKPRKFLTGIGGASALLYMVYFISFFCGLTQCFEGVFLPEFRTYFALNYQQQMYVVFAKNIAFLLAIPVGLVVWRIGYRNCLAIAMLMFAVGTTLLAPGLSMHNYNLVLLGFLIIGSGFTVQMVVGSPLVVVLGPTPGASSRLNFSNALGAVAQILAPASLAFLIPAAAVTIGERIPYMEGLFVALGALLFVVAAITAVTSEGSAVSQLKPSVQKTVRAPSMWRRPRVVFGALAIFLLLGGEAGLFAFFRNYVQDPSIAGISAHRSEQLYTVYFALFALGRLAASWVQKKISPLIHLIWHLFAAIACILVAAFAKGVPALVAVTVLAFFVSIFFPTLYAIAIEGMGEQTGAASGLLILGFLGGAFLPVLQGRVADSIGLQRSYLICIVIYLVALAYVLAMCRFNRNAPSISTSTPVNLESRA